MGRAGLLPRSGGAREALFCRCRVAFYDWLRLTARWLTVVWVAQLLGVCIVLYFAVESNIETMDPVQRREVVGFGVLGAALLCARVLFFSDSMDGDADGEA